MFPSPKLCSTQDEAKLLEQLKSRFIAQFTQN